MLALTAAALGFAGCTGDAVESTPTRTATPTGTATPLPEFRPGPFVLWNHDDRTHEIRLSVHGPDDTAVFRGSWTLEPDESREVDVGRVPVGAYRFVARADGHEAAHEYVVDECAPDEYFQVLVGADGRPRFRRLRETVDPPRC
jgi:hypothetical protein